MERNEHVNPVGVKRHLYLIVGSSHEHYACIRECLTESLRLIPVEALVLIHPDVAVLVLVCSDGHVDLVAGIAEDPDELRRLCICVAEHLVRSHICHELEIVEHIVNTEVVA